MATKKQSIKSAHSKKEFRKEITTKLDAALTELKSTLGEKEFQHRLKKAAKIFVNKLHEKDFNGKEPEKIAVPAKKSKSVKKTSPKKKVIATE